MEGCAWLMAGIASMAPKGDVYTVAAKAAEYPRNVLRLIFMFRRILVDRRPSIHQRFILVGRG
jgi:hypothetical protein